MPEINRSSLVWSLLVVIPAVLTIAALVPGLGEFSQGLWPEWFLFEQKGAMEFGELAQEVRMWTAGTLVNAAALAVALYVWTRQAWRRRLRTFDVEKVSRYQLFAWTNIQFAFFGCAAIAVLAVAVSESLRAAAPVSWVLFAVFVGTLGSLQLLTLILGIGATLRLYRGK